MKSVVIPIPRRSFRPSRNIRKQENEHRILLTGDIPSPVNPPSGCPFHPRCRYCMDICKKEKPQLKTMADGTQVACHLKIE